MNGYFVKIDKIGQFYRVSTNGLIDDKTRLFDFYREARTFARKLANDLGFHIHDEV